MDRIAKELRADGWDLLTGVLTHRDDHGARLRQVFTRPVTLHGPFVELVQRLPGEDGAAFDGFDTENIDDLYDALRGDALRRAR